jgi:ABC-type molybdate transport system substrate-binding protein
LKDAPNPNAAAEFLQFVRSDQGRDALKAAGFEVA